MNFNAQNQEGEKVKMKNIKVLSVLVLACALAFGLPAMARAGFAGKYQGVWSAEGLDEGRLSFLVDEEGRLSQAVLAGNPEVSGQGSVSRSGGVEFVIRQEGAFEGRFTGRIDGQMRCQGVFTAQAKDMSDAQGVWEAQGQPLDGRVRVGSARIVGPWRAVAGAETVLGAEASPATATGPIYYEWMPAPVKGQGTPRAVYRFRKAGPETVRLRVSNLDGKGVARAEYTLPVVEKGPEEYWPGYAPDHEWQAKNPAELGWDAAKLTATLDYAFGVGGDEIKMGTHSFLVVQNGYIIAERYKPGLDKTYTRTIASAGKPMTALMIGVAQDKGLLSLDDPMEKYLPQLGFLAGSGDTIRNHLTMTSGLTGAGGGGGTVNSFFFTPGMNWRYNTDAYHMLYPVLAAAAAGEPGAKERTVAEIFSDWLFEPIGADKVAFRRNRPRPHNQTGAATPIMSARDMARFGLLVLRGGAWDGRRVISPAFLAEATSPSQPLNPGYGYLFWLNGQDRMIGSRGDLEYPPWRFTYGPADAFGCHGAKGQHIIIVPSMDLVIVRQGEQPRTGAANSDENFLNQMFKRLMAAAPGTVRVETSASQGGHIYPDGGVDLVKGLSHMVWTEPEPGRRLADLVVNGVSFGPLREYEIKNAGEPMTIRAVFAEGDNTPPQVLKTIPGDRALNRYRQEPYYVFFSEDMDLENLAAATSLSDQAGRRVPLKFNFDMRKKYMRLTPRRMLAADTVYIVTIGKSATDTSGNPLLQEFKASFKTRP